MARHDNGLADFKRRLAAIPTAVRKAVQPALDHGAEEIVRTQRALAPRDDGDLQRSIRWSQNGELSRTVEAGGPLTTKPVRNGTDATYDYANAVEFGTRKMGARPFFYSGYRLVRKRVRSRVKRAVSKAVKESYYGGR